MVHKNLETGQKFDSNCKATAHCRDVDNQVIPSHGNPRMRRTLFDGDLFKYCLVKCQTFQQVSEKTF